MFQRKVRKPAGGKKSKSIKAKARIKYEDIRLFVVFAVFFLVVIFLIVIFERSNDSFKSLMDAVWWTIVTMSTTGYGDKVPATNAGKIVGMFTMIFGVAIASVFTGRISSVLVERRLLEGRGARKLKSLRNHILICGWKNDIKYLIKDILFFDESISVNDIVLMNAVGNEKVSALLMDEDLRGMHYLNGDYSDEEILKNANVGSARKALVLAETREGDDAETIDARVLVTVLMLHSLNPNIYICAEVMTVKYRNYLEHLRCDEVVLSEEYTRFLLANATAYAGITKVVSKLLNNNEGGTIKVVKIDPALEGKTFLEIFSFYKREKEYLAIGIVENMGREREFKRNALGEAQKAPDIGTLVKNLKEIKDIERNKTVINPHDGYIVNKHCGLIVISR